jgi:MFS family permease
LNTTTPPEKLWSARFVTLLIIILVYWIAFGMTLPITPGYAVSLGATLAFAGMITGVFSIIALFTRPLANIIGDRLNKKLLLLVFMPLTGVAVILYAFLPGIIWILPVRIAHGILFSLGGTLSFALGTGFIPMKRLGEGIGFLGVGQILGLALGPNIGLYMVNQYSYGLCFLVSGAVVIAAGLSVSVLRYDHAKPGPPSDGKPVARTFHFRDMIAIELLPNAAFVAILATGSGLTNSYLAMLGVDRNITNIGIYFIVNAIVLLASRPLLGKLTDRKGAAYAVIPGYLFMALGMAFIGMSYSLWLILSASVFIAIGGGALTALQADCLKRLPRERKTVATGTYFIGMDIGIGTGQVFGGIVIGSLGFGAAWYIGGVLMLIGLGFYLLYKRKRLGTIVEK